MTDRKRNIQRLNSMRVKPMSDPVPAPVPPSTPVPGPTDQIRDPDMNTQLPELDIFPEQSYDIFARYRLTKADIDKMLKQAQADKRKQ